VSRRPLLFVCALTAGDYVLWSWASSGNHDVLSLVSGLTLPPLAAACAWLIALNAARAVAQAARARRRRRASGGRARVRTAQASAASQASPVATASPAAAASRARPSRKAA